MSIKKALHASQVGMEHKSVTRMTPSISRLDAKNVSFDQRVATYRTTTKSSIERLNASVEQRARALAKQR